jgi:small subunit ribosomal protein S16
MSVKIRLKRMGAKKAPFFRVVVADEREARNGKFIDTLGTYDGRQQPSAFKVDEAKVMEWLQKGAQPTDTVRNLLAKIGMMKKFAAVKAEAKAALPKKEEKAKEAKKNRKPRHAKKAAAERAAKKATKINQANAAKNAASKPKKEAAPKAEAPKTDAPAPKAEATEAKETK